MRGSGIPMRIGAEATGPGVSSSRPAARVWSAVVLGIAMVVTGVWGPSELTAQQGRSTGAAIDTTAVRRDVEQRLGSPTGRSQILERLRASGMTREEARVRLQQLGYDPGLVDPYFDALESGGALPTDTAVNEFLRRMRWVGRGPEEPALMVGGEEDLRWMDELLGAEEDVEPRDLEVFGRSLFRRVTTEFDPVVAGPAAPDYRLGPGDEVILVLTGDVELSYTIEVSPEGHLFIPTVGQISVNGLTLGELEDQLYTRLARVYSGVRRGESATTRFQVSLGRLRVNQVFLVGEVVHPGAYWVSGASTVFEALYRAGGPSDVGSFRNIEVWRGGEVVRRVDLYDYLLHGDSRSDIRLEHGDMIFVPQHLAHVRVEGAVRRPAIYEVLDGTDVGEVLRYAGGVRADAVVRRVQVDRILPPDQRRPGVDRALVDVELGSLEPGGEGSVTLRDGDIVQVFAVSEERRMRVVLTGEVRRPGLYEWREGLTLWELIDRAEGLAERAYTPRGHIYRLNEADGSRRLVQTPLLADSAGRPIQDVLLADRDSIVVLSREALRNPELVEISGHVKHPGTYELAEGMRVQDLILAAGGFTTGAHRTEVEVARLPDESRRTERTARIYRVPLPGPDGVIGEVVKASSDEEEARVVAVGGASGGEIPVWVPDPEEFELRHGDHIFVRKAPGYDEPRTVVVTGEVMAPGRYVLEHRQERLLDLLERAGGLTDEAHPAGLQLVRDSNLVATDLLRALERPDSRFNLVMQAGDSLHVPEYDPTVLVTGAVTFESRILYVPGKGLDYYINGAGGYAPEADRGRVVVGYQDGERQGVRRFLFIKNKPAPGPGSTIYVPAKPASEQGPFNWGEFISRSTMVMSTIATLVLALRR